MKQTSFKGFTLIELLVVIAIIGILATLVITQVAGAQIKARNATAQNSVTEAGKSIEVWKNHFDADTVVIQNGLNTTVASMVVPAAYINGTNAVNWPFSGTESATTYSASITDTPSDSYVFGYATDTTGDNYCIGTNAVQGALTSTVSGFIINSGSSAQATSTTVDYGADGANPTGVCL